MFRNLKESCWLVESDRGTNAKYTPELQAEQNQ